MKDRSPGDDAFLEALTQAPRHRHVAGLGITYAKHATVRRPRRLRGAGVLDPTVAEAFATRTSQLAERAGTTPLSSTTGSAPDPVQGKSSGILPLAETWYRWRPASPEGKAAEAISDFVEAVRFDPDHARGLVKPRGLYRAQVPPRRCAQRCDAVICSSRNAGRRRICPRPSHAASTKKAFDVSCKVGQLQRETRCLKCALCRECIAAGDARVPRS